MYGESDPEIARLLTGTDNDGNYLEEDLISSFFERPVDTTAALIAILVAVGIVASLFSSTAFSG